MSIPVSICFENEKLVLSPFGSQDLAGIDQVASEVFDILSDRYNLRFIPSKQLNSIPESKSFLISYLLNHHTGKSQLFFLRDKQAGGRVVGIFELISPGLAMEHYELDEYPYFVEFYLARSITGCYIMSEILPIITVMLLNEGIDKLAAVVDRRNMPARKVLSKANFIFKDRFDPLQDLLLVSRD